jgi:hypothetical protein
MENTAWYQSNRFMKVGFFGGWIGRIRWFNISASEAELKPKPYLQLNDPTNPLRQKLRGKTARSFTMEWPQNERALVFNLAAKDGTTYARKILASEWSSCPLSENQMRQIETIMTSNLDMWICFRKVGLLILWFARLEQCNYGSLQVVRGQWPFSYEEYDYLTSIRLPRAESADC